MNENLVLHVLQGMVDCGVREFCFCPGNRNAPFFAALQRETRLKKWFWPEERSAAFFALGRARVTNRPVAVFTTSGSATAEILPATMEAFYTGIPLLLVTADRPRSHRGTGAPNSAEQVGILGCYAPHTWDVEGTEKINLSSWSQKYPAHLNVCLDEPLHPTYENYPLLSFSSVPPSLSVLGSQGQFTAQVKRLDLFLSKSRRLFVVVSVIKLADRAAVKKFLLELGAPVFLEGVSGLREDPDLQKLRVHRTDHLWKASSDAEYALDAVLRIGGVPTFRLWRDIDKKPGINVLSINHVPFSGSPGRECIDVDLHAFFTQYEISGQVNFSTSADWLNNEKEFHEELTSLFAEEPRAEPTLVHALSQLIPTNSLVFVGTSLPIREWDLAASTTHPHADVHASRGVTGIDGQISTLLGLCQPGKENWGIIGDLTALYDLAGPWILRSLQEFSVNIVVINNSGGQIFSRWISDPDFLNAHAFSFKALAEMWQMDYERWETIPDHDVKKKKHRLIEIVPDNASSERFWSKLPYVAPFHSACTTRISGSTC